jgi:hypothetical protein
MKTAYVLIALFTGDGVTATSINQFDTKAECVADIQDVLDNNYKTYWTKNQQELDVTYADFDCVAVFL